MPTFVSGVVDPFGKVFSGAGFKVEKVDTGLCTIIFTEEFNTVPAVTATQIYPWPFDADSKGGDTRDNAVIVYIAVDRVRIKTGDDEGKAKNRAFSFIAAG